MSVSCDRTAPRRRASRSGIRPRLWVAAAGLLLAAGGVAWSLRPGALSDREPRHAWRAFEAGRLAEAESLVRPRAERGELPAVALLARIRLEQDRPESTVRMLGLRFQELGDSESEALEALGQAYRRLGRTKEAYPVYRKLAELRPDDVEVLAVLAELTYRHAGLAEALGPYERLQRLEPANPAWPRSRGRIYMEIDRYEPAAEAFDEALRLAPDEPDLHFDLAEAEFLAGRPEACLEHLQSVRNARPADGRVPAALAECLKALGRLDEARDELDSLLRRDPTNPRGLRLRAELHTARREFPQALGLLERARAADPRDWRVLYQLSIVYDRLGRRDDAREAAASMRDLQREDAADRF